MKGTGSQVGVILKQISHEHQSSQWSFLSVRVAVDRFYVLHYREISLGDLFVLVCLQSSWVLSSHTHHSPLRLYLNFWESLGTLRYSSLTCTSGHTFLITSKKDIPDVFRHNPMPSPLGFNVLKKLTLWTQRIFLYFRFTKTLAEHSVQGILKASEEKREKRRKQILWFIWEKWLFIRDQSYRLCSQVSAVYFHSQVPVNRAIGKKWTSLFIYFI